MAYGTPERADDLEAYYTDIRRGRPPAPEQLADLRRRYDAIGGLSPLAERTRAQAAAVARALGGGWVVGLGLKHAEPRIEAAAEALLEAGVDDGVTGIVLAPHHSALSVGQYHERAAAVLGDRYRGVGGWGTEPALVALLAERVRAAVDSLAGCERIEVLVTAHSLPVRCLELDDPTYPEQLTATGEAVAAAAGLGSWRVAWQSAGRTPEPWLGPDVLEVVKGLPGDGFDGVVVCPAGFTSDHLEVLYDVDVEAAQLASSVGVRLARTASLNDDPAFVALLADLLRR
jgi:ferrochelatase